MVRIDETWNTPAFIAKKNALRRGRSIDFIVGPAKIGRNQIRFR